MLAQFLPEMLTRGAQRRICVEIGAVADEATTPNSFAQACAHVRVVLEMGMRVRDLVLNDRLCQPAISVNAIGDVSCITFSLPRQSLAGRSDAADDRGASGFGDRVFDNADGEQRGRLAARCRKKGGISTRAAVTASRTR